MKKIKTIQSKVGKVVDFFLSPGEGLFGENSRLQTIIPISQTLGYRSGYKKPVSYVVDKIKTAQFQYLNFLPNQGGPDVGKVNCALLFIPYLVCNMTTFKRIFTIRPHTRNFV